MYIRLFGCGIFIKVTTVISYSVFIIPHSICKLEVLKTKKFLSLHNNVHSEVADQHGCGGAFDKD
jgi:hypothetical protein